MRKTMQCKSAPEIDISIDGGDTVLLRFDMSCMINLQEIDGGLNGLFTKSMPEMAAAIIYAAGKDHNENFELEDARRMVICMSIGDIVSVIDTFAESSGTDVSSVNEATLKKIIAQYLK